jgi:hypothetical protein
MKQLEKLIDRKLIFALTSLFILTHYATKVHMADVQYIIGFSSVVGGYLAVRYFEGRNTPKPPSLPPNGL